MLHRLMHRVECGTDNRTEMAVARRPASEVMETVDQLHALRGMEATSTGQVA